MKKSLTFIFVFLLALCFVSLSKVNAKTDVAEGAVDGTDYLAQEVYLKNYDFEDLIPGENYTANFTSGIYTNYTLQAVEEINGVSLKYTTTDANTDIVEVFSFDDMGNNTYRSAGTYALSFKVKLENAAKFAIWVVRNYDEISGGQEGIITEYRRIPNYESGVMTSVTNDDVNGWRTDWSTSPITIQPGYKNLKETITDGILEVYLEYEVTEDMVWGTQWTPTIAFKPQLNAGGSMIIDDIQVTKVGEDFKYFTTVWDTSIEDLNLEGNPWDGQPIWANSMGWETESPLDGTHSIRVDGSATNDPVWGVQVGGFDTTTEGKRMLKTTGLHYIQMDVDSVDFEWFNIWTSGNDYFDIKFTLATGTWSTAGKVQNFKAQDLGTCWRISFYVDYTDITTPHNISVYNGSGSILFDNLVIAYADNSPYVSNGKYDLIDTQDVVVDINLKDQEFVALNNSEGTAVDTSLYSIVDGKLTIKKEMFSSLYPRYVFSLVSTGGERQFEVVQNDNRVVITGVSATISKVYDGTTTIDTSGVSFVLAGVNEGDEVTLTADLAFADKNVGNNKEIVVSNAVLSGNDAGKYALPETVVLTGSVTPKTLTVEFAQTGLTKVYDGTTSATVSVQTVNGVVEGDEVSVVATGTYNSAGVDANEINVTLTLEGAQKDNYAIEDGLINVGVEITPKAIQVVANAQTKQEEATDPELTYTVTGLIGNDALTGSLARSEGEAVGEYDITLGTLSAGANYEIEFTSAKLTITEKPADTEPTPDPGDGEDDGCKLFGYELVMQLVLFLSVFGVALYFVRRK